MIVMHAGNDPGACRPPTNDERRAEWAWRWYASGAHRLAQVDELPPCVGEAMRDVLAERRIATLADWEAA